MAGKPSGGLSGPSGGPFWASKDKGAWSIPKGEYADGEEPFEAAKRDFFEETGFLPQGTFLELSSITQSGGKIVIAWAVERNCDPDRLTSKHILKIMNRCWKVNQIHPLG